ncbi:hypothetical protein FOA52_015226 [Chlamydomonas sp. UWO 241]|nr:hypothetical protein FOA52_015226 [Chlamydomonas sp. UWO 241]
MRVLLLVLACGVALTQHQEHAQLSGGGGGGRAALEDGTPELQRESTCSPRCTEHGTCNEELGRCDCPITRDGFDCSRELLGKPLKDRCRSALFGPDPDIKECTETAASCSNNCNLRGKCKSGFCHCQRGFYGIDCSLSLDVDGNPVLLAGKQYATRKKRPHVYVYELPPSVTQWVNYKRLDRPTHNLFTQRLLSSGARTADGDAADWYFISVRCRMGDSHLALQAIEYVRQTWPWWNATGGARHAIIHTGDLGVQETSAEVRTLTANATWLTHWGLHQSKRKCCHWDVAHRPEKDVVLPVYISGGHFKQFGFDNNPMHPLYANHPFNHRSQPFFFAGRICGDRKEPDIDKWPNCRMANDVYSANVRQKVHYHYHNRTNWTVASRAPSYDRELRRSIFCLAPLGGGHGQRQIIVAAMGCIPVTIGDGVYQPLEPALDWKSFSVQIDEADIPTMHETLDALIAQPEVLRSMQDKLACAAQHLLYGSITGGVLGDAGKYDAFESTLEVLRAMQAYPDADPSEYSALDAEFKAFMECRDTADASPPPPRPPVAPAELDAKGRMKKRRGRGGAPIGLNGYDTMLCSHSWLDAKMGDSAPRPPCRECLVGASPTHGYPGGAICCGSGGDVSACPRPWE